MKKKFHIKIKSNTLIGEIVEQHLISAFHSRTATIKALKQNIYKDVISIEVKEK